MRIVLNGVETHNKGAELMLYAILQEIERRYPSATVFLPDPNISQGHKYIKTNLDFRPLPDSNIFNFLEKLHIPRICKILNIPSAKLTNFRVIKDIDYFIDGSGFHFSDQWNIDELEYNNWKYRLEGYKRQGTKIIFLPQAFGPCDNIFTKKILNLIISHGTLIYPREQVSMNYLKEAANITKKVRITTDFTSLVHGEIPAHCKHLIGKVVIIPNLRMVDKGTISINKYLNMMANIVKTIRSQKKDAFLLNHEGIGDEHLCLQIKEHIGDIETVTKLNAIEVKGLISSSYLCITSRYHGLASALNSCVPCLATSWSHKYAELYKDYNLSSMLLDLNDFDKVKQQIINMLDSDTNATVRNILRDQKSRIQQATRNMWKEIWNC